MKPRVLLVEDNVCMREATAEFLEATEQFVVCAKAECAEDALEMMSELEVDLAVVDLSLPKMDGVELVEHIGQCWPKVRCVIFSGHGEAPYVERALKAGSYGYILKEEPRALLEALPQVLNGERYLSDRVTLPD